MLGTKSPAVDQLEAAFEPEADESDSSIQQCVYSLHQEQPTRQRRFGSEHLFRTLLVTCSHTSIATKKVMDNLSLKMITIFGPNFLRPRRLFCHFMPTRAGAMGGVTMFASYTRASGPRKGQTYVFECSTVGRGLEAKSCRADRGLPTLQWPANPMGIHGPHLQPQRVDAVAEPAEKRNRNYIPHPRIL